MTGNGGMAGIQDLLTAKQIIHIDRYSHSTLVECKLMKYGGARWDRMRERNVITTGLGMPKPGLREFWSLDRNGAGDCLANVLWSVVRGEEQIIVDGKPLKIESNGFEFQGEYMRWPPGEPKDFNEMTECALLDIELDGPQMDGHQWRYDCEHHEGIRRGD